MSYCRWSSDNGNCDLYIYKDVRGGWTTHVAAKRFKELCTINAEGILDEEPIDFSKYQDACQKQHEWRSQNKLEDIDLPHAGETFNHASPGECAANARFLASIGYRVPQYAIDALEEEHSVAPKGESP